MIISKIIPDERSNQLIVIATERSYQRVKRMVDQLDREISSGEGDGRIHVYYCENANCDELAQTLGAVTGVTVNVSSGGAGGRSRSRGGQAAPPPAAAPAGGGQQQGIQNLLFEGDVRINFDRPTNSLIIVSSLKDYQAVRRVIAAAGFAAQAGVRRGDDPRGHARQAARPRRVVPRREAVRHPRARQPEPRGRRPQPGQDVVPGGRADRDDAGRRARAGAVDPRRPATWAPRRPPPSTSRHSAC